jgi:cyclopropane fatty-acyl-phospholipid synthase-like methyltransferase
MHSRTHHHIRLLLLSYCREKKPVLLDYGCGSGDLLKVVKPPRLKQYYGFDVNEHSLTALQKKFKTKNIVTQKVNTHQKLRLGKVNSIDAVVSIGVLQYMRDEQINEFFKESHRVLKRDGVFIFSCAHDQLLYKFFNIYNLFLPNRYFSRSSIISKLRKNGFNVKQIQARGPLLNPLFSYCIIFFFDAIDKVLFRTKGIIGPVGTTVRKIVTPVLNAELDLNVDTGYTLFVVATR